MNGPSAMRTVYASLIAVLAILSGIAGSMPLRAQNAEQSTQERAPVPHATATHAMATQGAIPAGATFTTLITTPRGIEGLTGDNGSKLYTAGSGAAPCPVWQIDIHHPALTVVGNVPASLASTCDFRGLAFDAQGHLYFLDQTLGVIYTLTPNAAAPPDATVFASGVPGTNGVVVDRHGNVWTTDGLAAQGRVWKITAAGANCAPPSPVNCSEVFRVQPMRNSTALGANVSGDGVGRQDRVVPPATLTIASGSFPVTPAGAQNLVANGLEFDREGNLLVIDTAHAALWRVTFDARGKLTSPTGCDKAFAADTLCLSNVLLASPALQGGDGIVLDTAGNIWVSVNERNAIVLISRRGAVVDVFRNPLNAQLLRNAADPAVGNQHILEFPTSPVLNGTTFCTANSDMDRGDNSPAAGGEADGVHVLGKISCMDQPALIPGMPLPVR